MSSTTRWIPNWKLLTIEIENKKIEICFDEVSKLYACPYCVPQCKKGGIPDYGSYFFNIEDLKEHIKAHRLGLWLKKEEREEEEEEEERIRAEEEEEEEE